jgi:tripartite-type tricarboxylate transporter receptor subunit TctC
VACRGVAAAMGGKYARTLLVDNKPGAAGRLVVEEVKRAVPDGTTILITPASVLTMYPHIYKSLTYDPITDLVPVSMVASFGFALVVGPKVPQSVTRLDDFFAWCRANPSAADCGNAGAGSLPHFLAVLLAQDAGIELTHVSYKGTSAALLDAAAGQISSVFATEASAVPLLQAGRLRALATSWEAGSPFLPQVMTFKEYGLTRLTQREWFGAFLPRGATAATVDFASTELTAASRVAAVRDTLRNSAMQPEGSTAQELQAALRDEHAFWGPVVKASGFTPET